MTEDERQTYLAWESFRAAAEAGRPERAAPRRDGIVHALPAWAVAIPLSAARLAALEARKGVSE